MSDSLSVTPVPAFADNYLWLIHDSHHAWIVDPGEAQPVIEMLSKLQLVLVGVLLTHHHGDHVGGLPILRDRFPHLVIYGPQGPLIPGITNPVKEGDGISLAPLNMTLTVLEVPGHTLDHVAYYGQGRLFCGDTLFAAGCGRVFEGTPEQMHHSLDKLAALPPSTSIYCAHEYTLKNLEFACMVDPDNDVLQRWHAEAQSQRTQHLPTLPSILGRELQGNPFLRVREPALHAALERRWGPMAADPVTIFTALRQWKNQF
ncbi:MAG: hydroxyacylglutathione hydrolase [Ferrovum sp.]|nr:hydroxyacylglutathione hydrolase [Ferrovum sp.]NDU88116.1 hydroxyacylglutathione hydrolase [Ferrovum sp.]